MSTSGVLEKRIPDLPPSDALTGLELLQVVQQGRSRKTFVNEIVALAVAGGWISLTSSQLAVKNSKYLLSSIGVTLSLPLTPATGDFIEIASPFGASQPMTVARNGNTIMNLAEDMTINTDAALATLVYDGSTWTVV